MSSRLHSGCRRNQTPGVFLSQRTALRKPRAPIWITIIPSPCSQCMAHSISARTITSSYIKSYYRSGRLRGRNADYTFWTEAVHLLKSYPVRFNANLSDAFSLFNFFQCQDETTRDVRACFFLVCNFITFYWFGPGAIRGRIKRIGFLTELKTWQHTSRRCVVIVRLPRMGVWGFLYLLDSHVSHCGDAQR